jgi:hypothetical protein
MNGQATAAQSTLQGRGQLVAAGSRGTACANRHIFVRNRHIFVRNGKELICASLAVKP